MQVVNVLRHDRHIKALLQVGKTIMPGIGLSV